VGIPGGWGRDAGRGGPGGGAPRWGEPAGGEQTRKKGRVDWWARFFLGYRGGPYPAQHSGEGGGEPKKYPRGKFFFCGRLLPGPRPEGGFFLREGGGVFSGGGGQTRPFTWSGEPRLFSEAKKGPPPPTKTLGQGAGGGFLWEITGRKKKRAGLRFFFSPADKKNKATRKFFFFRETVKAVGGGGRGGRRGPNRNEGDFSLESRGGQNGAPLLFWRWRRTCSEKGGGGGGGTRRGGGLFFFRGGGLVEGEAWGGKVVGDFFLWFFFFTGGGQPRKQRLRAFQGNEGRGGGQGGPTQTTSIGARGGAR